MGLVCKTVYLPNQVYEKPGLTLLDVEAIKKLYKCD